MKLENTVSLREKKDNVKFSVDVGNIQEFPRVTLELHNWKDRYWSKNLQLNIKLKLKEKNHKTLKKIHREKFHGFYRYISYSKFANKGSNNERFSANSGTFSA